MIALNWNNSDCLCLLGGFDEGTSPKLLHQAGELAINMAKANIGLTCLSNGGDIITRVAQVIKENGGLVTCVVSNFLYRNEQLLNFSDNIIHSKDLQECKMLLFNLSTGFIMFPGQIEMLDVLSEYLTWMQRVHESTKPVYLINRELFWEPLLQMFERMKTESFLPENFHTRYNVFSDLNSVLSDFKLNSRT